MPADATAKHWSRSRSPVAREVDPAFDRLYRALGRRCMRRQSRSHETSPSGPPARRACPDVLDRAVRTTGLADEVRQEYPGRARADVFGVPSYAGQTLAVYGPVFPEAPPDGDEALQSWEHIWWLIGRDDFYEMKRWPRDAVLGRPPSDLSHARSLTGRTRVR